MMSINKIYLEINITLTKTSPYLKKIWFYNRKQIFQWYR
jgi:hypothetical protein